MRVMFMAGLFNERNRPDASIVQSDSHKKLALKTAQEGIVLLKNQNNTLPLDVSKIRTIAVIGPNADVCYTNGGGSSFVDPYYSVSPLEGISKRAGDKVKVIFAKGDNFNIPETNPVKKQYFLTPDKKENGLMAE